MGGLCTGFADSSYAREGPRVHSSVPPAGGTRPLEEGWDIRSGVLVP